MWASPPTESLRLLLTEHPPPFSREARENDVRPYGWKFQVCGEQRTKNKNPPEGGTGGLSAVRKIVFLRWIGG